LSQIVHIVRGHKGEEVWVQVHIVGHIGRQIQVIRGHVFKRLIPPKQVHTLRQTADREKGDRSATWKGGAGDEGDGEKLRLARMINGDQIRRRANRLIRYV
jgi:hypothetical protein